MSQNNIDKMSFKELRDEVQLLRDEVARMKRSYEDLFYNLDEDNFSGTLRKKTKNMESSIEQTAESIKMTVSKTLNFGEAILGTTHPSDPSSGALPDNLYFWKSTGDDELPTEEQGYYYYNNLSEQWEKVHEDSVYSTFIQTEEGFEFNGKVVKISGDLITEGTITGTNIVREGDDGTKVTLNNDGISVSESEEAVVSSLDGSGLVFYGSGGAANTVLSSEGLRFADGDGYLKGWSLQPDGSGGKLRLWKDGYNYFEITGDVSDYRTDITLETETKKQYASLIIDLSAGIGGSVEFKGLSFGSEDCPNITANEKVLATQEWVENYIKDLTISTE